MAWNRPKENGKGEGPSSHKRCGHRFSQLKGLVAGAVVVLGAAVAAWWLLSDSKTPLSTSTSTSTSLIKEVTPAKVARQGAAFTKKRGEDVASTEKRGEDAASTNRVETEQEAFERRRAERKAKRGPRAFKTASDQLLAMAMDVRPGEAMPPLPIDAGMEKDFRRSLETPIEILETDPPRIKELKEKVIAARAEMKAMLDNGEKFSDVLAEYQRHHEEDAQTYNEVRQEMLRILDSGDREGARKYADRMNLALQQMGIAEIKLPSEERREMLKKMREEREYRARMEELKQKQEGKKE